MVLVVVIVVAWIAYFGVRLSKRRMGDGVNSVIHFHHQLRVLEHSTPPPIVAPAFRLRSIDGNGELGAEAIEERPVLTVVGADKLPKPALAFLAEPTDTGAAGPDYDGRRPWDELERLYTQVPPPAPSLRATRPDAFSRQLVRRRRRDTLAVLSMAVVATFAIGMVPGAGPVWIVTAVSLAALVAYVALLVRYRRLAEERSRKLRYLYPDQHRSAESADPPAASTPIGGRYAHPAYRTAGAR